MTEFGADKSGLAAIGRYQVIEGSVSRHCCFSFTIVDTSRPLMIGGKHCQNRFESICECFEQEEANMIVAALNYHAMMLCEPGA